MADPKEDDFLDDIEDAASEEAEVEMIDINCLLYTSPSPRDFG